MKDFTSTFLQTFVWYRELSLNLLDQLSDEDLNSRISERSLPLRHQFIDLGIMQLKLTEMLTKQDLFKSVPMPDENTATKDEVRGYINRCDQIFKENLPSVDPNVSISWFGRMTFNYEQALNFLLAHEAMHHGEILSGIFANGIEMPAAFKNTWGFEL